jgi:hypothetical protein
MIKNYRVEKGVNENGKTPKDEDQNKTSLLSKRFKTSGSLNINVKQ